MGRDKQARKVKAAEREARRQLVLQYTLAGATTREIAATLARQGHDITHATVANDRKAVLAEMREENQAGADHLRELYNSRYDRLIASRWGKAVAGDDNALNLVLRTMDAQRKINGIDAPAAKPIDALPEDLIPTDANAVDPGLSLAAFAEDVLGVHLSDMQLAMASLVLANQRSAIAGCHASGKTYLFAILVVWWLYRYDDGIVSIVATRELQTDHLWGWVTTFWNTCPRLRSALGSDARLLANSLTVSPRRYAERTAAGVSTAGGVAQATGIQGIHSEHVLHVFEEADGIHDAVYRAKEGSMTSVGNKLAMLFNPLRRTGPAYQAMRSDQFAKMNISGFDSPNLAGETLETFLERYHADPDDPWFHEPDVFPGLTGRLWLRDLYQRCGQWEDQEWYGRGLGAYAPSALNNIFDVELVHSLVVPQKWEQQGGPVQIGIDWAAGRGGDLLAIAVSQPREDGYHLVDLQHTNYTPDTLEWAMAIIRRYLYYASAVGIDTGGGGAEFYSSVQREIRDMTSDRKPSLVRVNFGRAAIDDDSYRNTRAELYFGMQRLLRRGRFHANLPPDLQEEFIEQTYEWVGEDVMMVLPKRLQRERGLRSPDRLESICMSVAPLARWRAQSGQVSGV